jgi:hypothetical protein
MKPVVVVLAALTLLAGCASSTPTYTPVATYSTAPTYVVPNTTYTYTPAPSTMYVVPNTTYVPSASPGYFYASQADCARMNGLWYPATNVCQLRP